MCGCDIRRIEEGKEVLPCWMKMNVERFEEHRRVRLLEDLVAEERCLLRSHSRLKAFLAEHASQL